MITDRTAPKIAFRSLTIAMRTGYPAWIKIPFEFARLLSFLLTLSLIGHVATASAQGAAGFLPGAVGYQQPTNATNAENAQSAQNATLAATAQHLDSAATIQANQIQGSTSCSSGQALTSISTCTNTITNAINAGTATTAGFANSANTANFAASAGSAATANTASFASGAASLQAPACVPGSTIFEAGIQSSFQLPLGCSSLTAKLWGAGGGGGQQFVEGGTGGNGGGGGYTTGTISGLDAWTTLSVTVGLGGRGNSNQTDGFSAGGALSSIFLNGQPVFIAGGGGGGGQANANPAQGGAGGGTTGQTGEALQGLGWSGGLGGSQTSGGGGGNMQYTSSGSLSAAPGYFLHGGVSPPGAFNHAQSNGGDGYYGGGGAGAGGAGGGSGYVGSSGAYGAQTLTITGTTITGNFSVQANSTDPANNSAGAGGVNAVGAPASPGTGGLVIISWP